MSIPFDLDVPIFFYTCARIIFHSKTRLRQNSRPVPFRFDIEQFSEDQLTPRQRAYLRPFDEQLAAINYRPLCTFRASNYGNNLLRRYSSPTDTASCALTIVEVKVMVNGRTHFKNSCSASFSTRFVDGRRLDTRNTPLKSLFDQPPFRIVQEAPNTGDLATLKRKHDARAAKLGAPATPPQTPSAVFEEFQAEHERYAKYQLEIGNYKLAPGGASFLVTDKVYNRGIRNHFLPFGRRISLANVLFTALLGAFLPLLGILKLAPWAEGISRQALFLLFPLSVLVIGSCYALAGAIMALLCDSQKFLWMMLVTYVPTHAVAGWTFGWHPFTTLAFVSCYFVAQWKRRKALILQQADD